MGVFSMLPALSVSGTGERIASSLLQAIRVGKMVRLSANAMIDFTFFIITSLCFPAQEVLWWRAGR